MKINHHPKQRTRLFVIGAFVLLALTLVGLIACKSNEVTAPIVGPIWEWTGTTDSSGGTTAVADPTLYTIQFLPNSVYQGRADCNTISGNFRVDGFSLQISPGATSLVACPTGSLAPQYTTQLFAASSFALQGTEMTIKLQANAGEMHFRQAGAPSNASVLVGPIWLWRQTLANDNAAVNVPDPNQYTIQFTADGQVQVKADCNQGGGVYIAGANNSLTIQISRMTLVTCPTGSLSDQFVKQLQATTSFFTGGADLVLNINNNTAKMIFGSSAPPTVTPTAAIATTTPLPSPVPPTAVAPTAVPPTATATSVPVTVPPACAGAPKIQFFQASQPNIAQGQNTVLQWGTVTNATSVAIDQGVGNVGTPGSVIVTPATTTTYTMTATGCGGIAKSTVTVTVAQPTAAPPTQAPPTAVPPTQPPPTAVPTKVPPTEVPTKIPPTEVPTKVPPTQPPGADIIGIHWKWTSAVKNDGAHYTPSDPNLYTVDFHANGQVSVRADCNNASGTYVISGNSLTIQLPVVTGALCSPESLSQQFLGLLQEAASYSVQGNALTIELKADSGSMSFIK